MKISCIVPFSLAASLVGACGGGKSSSETRSDLSGTSLAPDLATTGTCTAPSITNAATIDVTHSTDPDPVLSGGAIADGTYVLSSQVAHETGDGGALSSESAVLVLDNGTIQFNSSADEPSTVVGIWGHAWNGVQHTNGSQLLVSPTCGLPEDETSLTGYPYASTPTSLTLAVGTGGLVLLDTFTKQ